MDENVKKLGSLFKGKREEMHLTLKEVENATSIRMMYLQAIEEGNVQDYLSAVYALGFIKQYAAFLGFNPEKIVAENAAIFKKNVESSQEFDYGIGTLEVRNKHVSSNSSKRISNVVWVIVSALLMLMAWFFAKALGVV